VERSSSSIPPDIPPQQAIARPSNAPPQASELVAQDESDVIEATQDTHEDEEHIPPSADEDEDDGDPANDTEKGQGEADQGQGGVEEQYPNDPKGRMPGQLAPVAQVQQEIWYCAQQKEIAKQKIRDKLGEEILMRQRNETITWKVIEESHADVEKDATDLGVQGMNLNEYSRGEIFSKLFLSLIFPDWSQKLELLNTAIEQKNSKNPKSQRVRIFSESEFLVCLGLIVGAPEYGVKGSRLWKNSIGEKNEGD